MNERTCDVLVIGAGTAGLAAERTARRAGANTVLVDDRFVGTTCATVGCMPSKLLIAAGLAAHDVRAAGKFGVRAGAPAIDGVAVLERVRRRRDAFAAATRATFTDIPSGVCVTARARFLGPNLVELDSGDRIAAKAIVIATGSRPRIPSALAALGDLLLTNESLFEQHDLPASMAVIGAGPQGLELAQALSRLGVVIAVFDEGHSLAGLKHTQVAKALGEILACELPIHLGVALSATRDGDEVRLDWKGDSSGTARFERVLVAAGRPPSLDGLNLKATGLVLDEHGSPAVDEHTMRCGVSAIFMAGDAQKRRPVLHEAMSEGAIAGHNAARCPAVKPSRRSVAFSIMFTDPPLAVLGEIEKAGLVVGCASFADQGRAKIEARNAGLARLFADPSDGRLVGAVMLGPDMDHAAHLIAWAIERGETADALLALPFYHPMVEEGLKPALRAICDTLGTLTPDDADDGKPSGA